jgi:hypothetical protein
VSAPRRSLSIQLRIVSLTLLILVAGLAISAYVTVTNQRGNLLKRRRGLAINGLLNLTIRNHGRRGAPIAVNAMTASRSRLSRYPCTDPTARRRSATRPPSTR